MNEQSLWTQYRETAKEAVTDYYFRARGEFPEDEDLKHAIDLAASIMMTRDNFIEGGSFVRAVVNNDLGQAVDRADSTAINHFRVFVHVLRHVHLNPYNN